MIGVLCSVTAMVSAAIIITGTFSVTQNVNQRPTIEMLGPEKSDSIYTDQEVTYSFQANVPFDLAQATITVDISTPKGMEDGNVNKNAVTVTFDSTIFHGTLKPGESGHYQCIVDVNSYKLETGMVSKNDVYSGSVSLAYNVALSYDMTVTMSGIMV
jgi:hypothetical protein